MAAESSIGVWVRVLGECVWDNEKNKRMQNMVLWGQKLIQLVVFFFLKKKCDIHFLNLNTNADFFPF